MAGASDSKALNGCSILVTRPLEQGEELCRLIDAAGGLATHLPCIAIEGIDDAAQDEVIGPDASYDWLIFISRNAVKKLEKRTHWPTGKIAAIGASTAKALEEAGHPADLIPDSGHHTSEDLLNCEEMLAVDDLQILIVRGEGGRSALARELEARGAIVSHAVLYRRTQPDHDAGPQLEQWLSAGHPVLTISSGEGLNNFLALCPENIRAGLNDVTVIVPSERIARLAEDLELFAHVVTAANATDPESLRALVDTCLDGSPASPAPTDS